MFQAPGLPAPTEQLDEAQVARVTAPSSQTFEDVLLMLKLLKDPDAYQAKMDALMASTVKADEARRAMVRQMAAFTAKENENEHWQKQLAERFMTVQQAEAQDRETKSQLLAIAADIRHAEDVLKREVLRYANISVNKSLQQLPSFSALARMVLGERNDVHLDNNDTLTERGVADGPAESVPGAPAGATITRTTPRLPKPTRAERVRGG